DDIGEIDAMDYLKIDVQGSELAVFQNGRRRLAEAVVIQTEVSFLPLYKKQPVFGEIDLELRSQGFIPHA
ncbi:FkbM family methyltransferase, partial [Campylobacter jejuni]